MQKAGRKGRILEVAVVVAQKGDIVFVPPDYGHITINGSEKVLKMANWVCRDFSSLYEPVKQLWGGAYFLLENGFVRNPNYAYVPKSGGLSRQLLKSLVYQKERICTSE